MNYSETRKQRRRKSWPIAHKKDIRELTCLKVKQESNFCYDFLGSFDHLDISHSKLTCYSVPKEYISTAQHHDMQRHSRQQVCSFQMWKTNSNHKQGMPIVLQDTGADKAAGRSKTPFLSLEAVRMYLQLLPAPMDYTSQNNLFNHRESYTSAVTELWDFLLCSLISDCMFMSPNPPAAMLRRLWRPCTGNSWGNSESKIKWQSASWSAFLGKLHFTVNSVLTQWL